MQSGSRCTASAATNPLLGAFLGSLVIAEQAQAEVTPHPTEVVSVIINGEALTVGANKRAGTAVSGTQLRDLLGREPSTWSGVITTPTGWQWDLSRARLRPYRAVRSASDYLAALEVLVGVDHAPPAVHLAPLALPDAFDHLDLAWRLLTTKRLVRVPRASVAAKLTQPVNSAEEFESRCSGLSDLLGSLVVPRGDLPNESKPLQRLAHELTRLLGPEDRSLASVTTLRRIAGIRNAQQHSGSAARYDVDRAQLGLPRFGSDWAGAWDHIRLTTVFALTTIRESIEGIIDQAEDSMPA
jgi:hypothetical protein